MTHGSPTPASTQASARLSRRSRYATVAVLGLLTAVALCVPLLVRMEIDGITVRSVLHDAPMIPLFVLATLLTARRARPGYLPQNLDRAILPASILAIVLIGWAGHYLVFDGFDFTRDEQMATFDAIIFASGRLAADIPAQWRPFAEALNLMFMLPIGTHEMWVSAYLPVHALFRVVVGSLADPALASPLLAALAAYCVHGVARGLWPDSRSTPVVALLLYLGSSQVLVTSMTAFSMTMHLALNMLWLLLFLSGRREGHVAAAVVGFLATGIHQPLFHPLFVLPFLLVLAGMKRWKLLAFYLCSYALISVFWLLWPLWISGLASTPAMISDRSAPAGYFDRLLATVEVLNLGALWLTASNLLRFAVWQHLLLVPLAILGVLADWHRNLIVRALAVGFVLPIVAMAVLLPWQGLGWGYRYLHPVLGNAILLACFGWRSLENSRLDFMRPMAMMSAASTLVLLPIHCWFAAQVVRPFAQVSRDIAAVPADIVVIDTSFVPYGDNLVFNLPDLNEKPIRLVAEKLSPPDIAALCQGRTIAFFDPERMRRLAETYPGKDPAAPSAAFRRLQATARDQGCYT